MKKSNKKTPKTHLPKYGKGGLGMVGKDIKNTGLFLADTALAEWAPNLISQDEYSDTKYGANLGKVASVHESFDSMSPIRKNVSKMWTDDRSSGMNEEQQKAFNQVQPIAKVGSSIGEMWTAKGLGSIGQGSTDAAGNFKPSQANGFAKSLGDLSQAGTKNYTPNMYDNNSQTTVGDLSNSRRASMYPNGGIITQPNAELELDESVLHTDGTATQLNNEPSHEEGGKPMKLNPGDMIFSDKIKWNGKTAADHNKPYTRIIQKATKDLENSSLTKESKLSAHLNLMAATKASQAIFAKQEEIKQSRIDNYTKRLGGIQKYPYGGTSGQTLNDNSIVAPSIGQDPRYYTYQGNQVMKPGLRALNKDSGVTTDIGMDNYNNLLNTRTQVRDSNVNVGNQLPKFEYINDPAKGDYNTQFENYKKVNVGYFRAGGKLPQYSEGGKMVNGTWVPDSYNIITPHNATNSYKPGTIGYYDSMNSPDKPSNDSLQSSYGPTVLPWNRTNDSGNSAAYDNTVNPQQFQEVTSNAKSNINMRETNPNSKNFDWKGLATQGAYFAANNAGNIYDLARADKTETRRYDKMTAKLLDPTAAIRDAVSQTRRAEYNIRNASGGNAGTYLANRVGLNAQNTENIARIHQNYENANAGITNQTSQYNTGIANEEILANAKIRANARNIKQSDIASIGSNSANQMNDVRNTNMDKKRLDNLVKMYPALAKDPEMLKYLTSFA